MLGLEVNRADYKILVVDDIATNVMLLKAILSKAKYNIITALSGEQALDIVEREHPDLILLDVMMPGMDGYEVIRRLKSDERFSEIPVIFLTALQSSEDVVKGFNLGASDYVFKPFNNKELITRVTHYISLVASERIIIKQSEDLKAAMMSRDKMYSVIAHDLRSPIGTMKMVFNMLSTTTTAEVIGKDNADLVSMGNDIAENTFMLLDNLLKWTKSQVGRMNTVFQDVNLSEVLLFSCGLCDLISKTKNIKVVFDVAEGVNARCDVDMIKTIIRNLLMNAIKFSNEGGKIILSMEDGDEYATIRVQDFGCGIAPENIPAILDPKVHFSTFGTKNEEGSGLGLQLCLEFVKRLGGKMWIDSKLGEGSTFSFTINKHGGPSETDAQQPNAQLPS